MPVVQICTAKSGVCYMCFVTALYWNKDRLMHQPPDKIPFSYNSDTMITMNGQLPIKHCFCKNVFKDFNPVNSPQDADSFIRIGKQ